MPAQWLSDWRANQVLVWFFLSRRKRNRNRRSIWLEQDNWTNSASDVPGLERVDESLVLKQVGYRMTRMRALAD
jgi:hypothetical protein